MNGACGDFLRSRSDQVIRKASGTSVTKSLRQYAVTILDHTKGLTLDMDFANFELQAEVIYARIDQNLTAT